MHAIPVQRSALKQRSECVGRGAKYRRFACMGGFGKNEKRMRDCPYVWLLCENVTQKHEVQSKQDERRCGETKHACCVSDGVFVLPAPGSR